MKRQHPSDPNLLWCPKCQGYFPLTQEYWYWRNDTQKWRPFCKICHQKNRHKYESACINCGTKFYATLEQIKKGEKIFCSHTCRTKNFIPEEALNKMAETQIKKGKRLSPGTEFKRGEHRGHCFQKGLSPWNDTNTIVSCPYCGKLFKVKPVRVRRVKSNYCSKRCRDKSRYNGGKKEQQRKRREETKNLTDRYIKALMKTQGRRPEEIYPLSVKIWRQRLAMKRNLKQLKKWREENESNSEVIYGQ